MVAALLLACALAAAPSLPAQGTYDLVLREVDGDLLASLHAQRAQAAEIFQDIAARTHKTLVGLERIGHPAPVDAALEQRPFNQLVCTLAGCVGARVRINPTTIELLADLGGGASAVELEEQATVAYLRALQSHPDHARGAQAEMALGEIQHAHGNLRAAIGHYELVARNHPDADVVPDALWRAGGLLQHLGDWTGAATKFSALANLRVSHVYGARTRLELARCLVHAGDARQALLLLDALDNLFPTTDHSVTKTRLFVRSLALRGVERLGEALAALAKADEMGVDPEWDVEATELRAEAFEYFEMPAEAARAWLRLAGLVTERERERALLEAARLADLAADPIAVLMIERSAQGTGAAPAIATYASRARAELGLDAATSSARLAGALERAQGQIGAHLAQLAVQELEPYWSERDALDEIERARLAVLYAQALDGCKGVEPALTALREAWNGLHTSSARKDVCVAAGGLLEKHGRFEDAARAFGGEL